MTKEKPYKIIREKFALKIIGPGINIASYTGKTMEILIERLMDLLNIAYEEGQKKVNKEQKIK